MGAKMGVAAVRLAQRGIPVFPCRPRGKEPLAEMAPNGVKDATTDAERVVRWWSTRTTTPNIGVACGGASRLLVVDIDAEGEASLAALEAEHGALPETVEVITASGRHLWLRAPEGVRIGNSAGLLGEDIDTRGDGGYVLSPPSIHPSGKRYEWSVDCASTIAPAPDWLVRLLVERTGSGRRTSVDEWREMVSQGVTEGQRNSTVAKLAGLLFRRLDPEVAVELLYAWNQTKCRPPLPDHELKRTLDSIAAREQARLERREGGR